MNRKALLKELSDLQLQLAEQRYLTYGQRRIIMARMDDIGRDFRLKDEDKKLCRFCFNESGFVWQTGHKSYWGPCQRCGKIRDLRRGSDVRAKS